MPPLIRSSRSSWEAVTPPTATCTSRPPAAGSAVAQPLDGRLGRGRLRVGARLARRAAPRARRATATARRRRAIPGSPASTARRRSPAAVAVGAVTRLGRPPGPAKRRRRRRRRGGLEARHAPRGRPGTGRAPRSSSPCPSTGAASASRTALAPSAETTGRRMTASVQRCQKPAAAVGARRPTRACKTRPGEAEDARARVDAPAQQRDQRRQQRRGGEHRDRDHEHRAERHRADRGVVEHPQPGQRDDHGQAGEQHRHSRRRHRDRARILGRAAGRDLLAVAGDDEERVVDGDADPDHRRHVGHEDRHLHHLREAEDQRAGDQHRADAERQRQQRGGERAEDRQQDQQHDREARRLGLGEVLLGQVLHRGPQRALADQVRRDAARARRRRSPAPRAGRRRRRWRRPRRPSATSGTTSGPPVAAWRAACSRAAGASAMPSTFAGGGGDAVERGAQLRLRRRPAAARAPPRAARAATPGKPASAIVDLASDCEPGTPKPPLERSSDWRAANGTAASRTSAQAIRTRRLRRRMKASRRNIELCICGAPGEAWLAGQPTVSGRRGEHQRASACSASPSATS